MLYLQNKPLSKRKALMGELEIRKTEEPLPSQEQNETGENNEEGGKNVSSVDLLKIPPGPNRSRAVANLLERRRVAELNNAFEKLRDLVPTYGDEDRALSKIKTLKYALNYMSHLSIILNKQANTGYFDSKTDFLTLGRRDPLLQKCRDHMRKRKVI
uniref:Transcription factor Atl1 n=1 Tax=Podocoryna carnea TaxID=6096 RepID=Q6W8W1_PODCA|nr:transcription factor Atl1 [Podocoryna carnea]